MATNKNKEKETAAAQAAPIPETQTEQTAPAAAAPERADKGKEEKRQKPAAKSAASVLENVGKAAIARHGFKEVFVTSDGQVFPLHSDAQHHAADLTGKEIIKVTE